MASSLGILLFFLLCCHVASASDTLVRLAAIGGLQKGDSDHINRYSLRQRHISSISRRLCSIKGGKKKEKTLKDLPDEEDEGDNELGADDEDYNIVNNEGGGIGSSNELVRSLQDLWTKTPPMTQIYIGASVVITLGTFLLNKNKWPSILNLDWKQTLGGLQLWRPITSFLFYGPFGLNYLLTIHFVWTYMGQLEKINYKTPHDFLVMMIFGASTLLVGYSVLGLSPQFLGHNLSTFLVYIWARIFEGTDVNVMDLFVTKSELLPWFFCLQTLVLEGELPIADFLGIVVGHLYHYLSKRKLLVAPAFIKDIFNSENLKTIYAKFAEDFE